MKDTLILSNPQTDTLAFKIYSITGNSFFSRDMESNFYSVLLVVEGQGILHYDLNNHRFCGYTLMRLPIYQPFRLQVEPNFRGYLLQLDAEFFWNHRRCRDVPCKNVLFDSSGQPLDALNEDDFKRLLIPLELMHKEFETPAICQYELMVSYAEIFLIRASRIISGNRLPDTLVKSDEPHLLRRLIGAIENYYSTKHSSSQYARLLNVTVKTLNRLTKSQLNKTVTSLIASRIITEAKRELYLTPRSVKEIATRLGFHDEAYFSRFFKRHAGMSPATYRKTVNWH